MITIHILTWTLSDNRKTYDVAVDEGEEHFSLVLPAVTLMDAMALQDALINAIKAHTNEDVERGA